MPVKLVVVKRYAQLNTLRPTGGFAPAGQHIGRNNINTIIVSSRTGRNIFYTHIFSTDILSLCDRMETARHNEQTFCSARFFFLIGSLCNARKKAGTYNPNRAERKPLFCEGVGEVSRG